VKSFDESDISIGEEGITITRLNPMGKVKIGDKVYEAHSIDGFVDPHEKIEVTQIEKNKLIIKQKR
jgi:membrane-bound ClpP family serine protease